MRTIGRVGVRAALLVVLALAWGVPAARAQALPPTGLPPVDDVIDQVSGQLPAPPPVAPPTVPALPAPDPGTPPGLPTPPSGLPAPPAGTPGGSGLPPVAAPDLGGVPAPGGAPDLGALPDFGDLPDLCGLGAGVPDADLVDCLLDTIAGGGGLPAPPDAVCDLTAPLPLPLGCPEDPGGPAGPGNHGGGGAPGGHGVSGGSSGSGYSAVGAMLPRTGGGLAAGVVGLGLVAAGGFVLRARRLVSPV